MLFRSENYAKFGIEDIPPVYAGYFAGFREWWHSRKPEVLATETKVYHKILRYAGTVDLLCIIDGRVTLVDYKTCLLYTSRFSSKPLRRWLYSSSRPGRSMWSTRESASRRSSFFSNVSMDVVLPKELDAFIMLAKKFSTNGPRLTSYVYKRQPAH